MAPMIGKDYRVINKFNNKFVFSRTALVLDNKIKHFPTDHALYLQAQARYRKRQFFIQLIFILINIIVELSLSQLLFISLFYYTNITLNENKIYSLLSFLCTADLYW